MKLEDFLEKTQDTWPQDCFKASFGRSDKKRWIVYSQQFSHAFLWSHLIEFTLNVDSTELVLYLSNHEIRVVGKNLQPLHKALMEENLEYIRAPGERAFIPLKEKEVVIQSIQILEPGSVLK
jgi:hypothetical protein